MVQKTEGVVEDSTPDVLPPDFGYLSFPNFNIFVSEEIETPEDSPAASERPIARIINPPPAQEELIESRRQKEQMESESGYQREVEDEGTEKDALSPPDKVKVIEVLSNDSTAEIQQSIGNTTEVMRMLPFSNRENQNHIRSIRTSGDVGQRGQGQIKEEGSKEEESSNQAKPLAPLPSQNSQVQQKTVERAKRKEIRVNGAIQAKRKVTIKTKDTDHSSQSSYKTEEIKKLKHEIRKLRKHAEFNQRLLMHTLTSRSVVKEGSTSRERKTTQASRRPSLELYPSSHRDQTIEVIDNRVNRSFQLPRPERKKEDTDKLSRKEEEWLASVESLKIENYQTALHAMNEYRTLLGHLERKELHSQELETIILRLEMRLSEIEKIVELTAIQKPEAAKPPTSPYTLRTYASSYMSEKENYSSQNGGGVSYCLTPESRAAFIRYGGGVQFSGIYSEEVNGVLELDTLPNLKEGKVRVYLPIADYRCFSVARISETVDSAELRALLLQFLNIDQKNKHDYILTIQTDRNEIERTCMSSDCPIRVIKNYSLFGIKDACFPRIYLRRVLEL